MADTGHVLLLRTLSASGSYNYTFGADENVVKQSKHGISIWGIS
jgi:hypothetical protein